MGDEKICGKHDVKIVDGKCWCCEQAKMTPQPATQDQSKTGVYPVATGGK